MQDYDVLIIGGGPAGSTLARSLKGTGLRVALMDKKNFPRPKVCAGWVTPEVMRLLNIDLEDYAQGRVLQNIHGFRISLSDQQAVESHYPDKAVSYGICRLEFDDYLLQRCGAELILAEAFENMQKIVEGSREAWVVNEQYKARLVVGAGGHFCPVARAIGSKGVSELAVAAQELEFEMNAQQKAVCSVKEGIPELFFNPDLLGYGWVLRKGDYLNIGLGREDKNKLSAQVKDFCDSLLAQGKIPRDMNAKFNGHAYLLYPHAAREMLGDKVLLIGDSAGMAYVRSGEGIRPAVESAILAAEVIRTCNRDYSNNRLQAYKDLIQQRFGPRLPPAGFSERLPLFIKKLIISQLMKTHWFTKNILIDKWFLQSQQKPLPTVRDITNNCY